ncbi:MAG: HAD-IIA family hydrolase [Chloroflexota bacterium]
MTDSQTTSAGVLDRIRGVVMDMDGVLWRGTEILPGVLPFVDFLRERHVPFVLASNNSTRTPQDYLIKLAGMGLHGVDAQQIITSGTTTVDYLKRHYPVTTRIHVLGGPGLKQMVDEAGFTRVDENADVVVAGLDFDLTYERIKRAALLIRAGAEFIGTNDDATFPSTEGLIPGAGSLLAALKTATGRAPKVMGKPGLAMFETALGVLGTDPEDTLMIGDRLNTDIAGARAAGLKTALVLTGVTTRDELLVSPTQPDGVFENLVELLAAWQPEG